MKNETAAYVMCNDKHVFWLEPFIKSFNRYNGDLKLFLIPFANNMSETKAVCSRHNVEIVDDEILKECDDIALDWLHNQSIVSKYMLKIKNEEERKKQIFNRIGVLRKFLTFVKSDFERSIFLDCDVIITKKFDELFFEKSKDNDVLYFAETEMRYCYPDEFIKDYTQETSIHHYNTGGFLCKPNLISLNDLRDFMTYAKEKNLDTLSHGNDQPIINMISILKKLKITANYSVLWPCGGYDLQDHNYMIHWAGGDCKKNFPMREYYDQYTSPASQILFN
jgi:alpha-N-acetylglucosamine transferase